MGEWWQAVVGPLVVTAQKGERLGVWFKETVAGPGAAQGATPGGTRAQCAAVNTGTGLPSTIGRESLARWTGRGARRRGGVGPARGLAECVEERHVVIAGEQAEVRHQHGAGGGGELDADAGQRPVPDEAEERGPVGGASRVAVGAEDCGPVGGGFAGGGRHVAGQQVVGAAGVEGERRGGDAFGGRQPAGRQGEGEERAALQGAQQPLVEASGSPHSAAFPSATRGAPPLTCV